MVVLAILALVACGSGSRPTFEPIPTPTIPPDFVKYSDELNTFSIQYPSDWQLNLSLMNEIEQGMKDFVQGKLDVSTESIGLIFMATGTNVNHSANIVIESLPSNVSVDEYYDAVVKTKEKLYPSIENQRISKINVGGRQAILTEATIEYFDFNLGLTGVLTQTQLMFVRGKVAWIATCEYPAEEDFAERCESIVRTLKILE